MSFPTRLFLAALLLTLSFTALGAAQEPQPPLSIAFIRTSAVLAAHPAGQQAAQLTEQARTELEEIATTLQPLIARANAGETLSPEESDTLDLSQRTYQETQGRYQQEIEAAAQPAEAQINEIISQIAEEAGEFTLEDVYEKVNRKLIRRHPHVFGDVTAETAGEVVRTWDAVKAAERVAAGKPLKGATHPLADLPRSMPAIEKARVLLGPRKGEREVTADTDADAIAASGATILAAVEAAIAAGVDPEQALDRALWTRFAATPQAMETTRP